MPRCATHRSPLELKTPKQPRPFLPVGFAGRHVLSLARFIRRSAPLLARGEAEKAAREPPTGDAAETEETDTDSAPNFASSLAKLRFVSHQVGLLSFGFLRQTRGGWIGRSLSFERTKEKESGDRHSLRKADPDPDTATAAMSPLSREDLKEILQQFECHFTWMLKKEDIDPDELEERIVEQIQFLSSKSKVRNYNLLAYVKFLKDKKDEALENLQKAEEAVPVEYPGEVEKESLVTWGNYAWVFFHMDNLTESQAYVKKVESVCKQLGSESPYRMELPQIHSEKGWALLKFGEKYYEKAKKSFEKALQKEPENPEFNSGYAITVYRLEDYYAKKCSGEGSSLEPLRFAVKLNPNDILVIPLLALKLQETNKVKEGNMCMKEALRKYPDIPYVLRYAAKFYRKKGDVKASLKHLKKALSLTPNSGFLHHQIGICYRTQYFALKKDMSKGKFQSILKMFELMSLCIFHFNKVVERKTKFAYAYIDLANIYAEQGQLRKADETFQKVFAMSSLTSTEKQQLHFNYGRFQERHRKSEADAMKQYLAGLKIKNSSFEKKKCERSSKQLFNKAVKKGAKSAEVFESLGFFCQRTGLKEKALETNEKVLEMDSANEEYLSAVMNFMVVVIVIIIYLYY